MLRSTLAALVLGATLSPARAQAPPAADAPPPAHTLPFPSSTPETHAVELALGGTVEDGLSVRVGSAPTWLRFETPEAEARIAVTSEVGSSEPVARLAFAVERAAPVGEEGVIELVVTDAEGTERVRRSFAVVVAAPELSLAAPWPNPARGGVAVSWTQAAGPVHLSVVDMLGREVAVLADGELAAGAHGRRLRSSALASGAYVVRLVSTTDVRAARLTVVR